jgi:hypothetical protein
VALAAEVAPGNQHRSKHSSPRLWALLDGLDAGLRPWLIRGDVGFGNEPVMREAERRHQPYLFKLRLTKGVKRAAALGRHVTFARRQLALDASSEDHDAAIPAPALKPQCQRAPAFCQSCSPIARSTTRRRLAIM